MTKRCVTSTGSREWTKEEMMSYLDWSKTEDERVELHVTKEMGIILLERREKVLKTFGRALSGIVRLYPLRMI
jgi:hypothetical protein